MGAALTRTGKDCLNGHADPLRYSNGNCRECLREKNAALQCDPEFAQRKRDRENARYAADPGKSNARSKAYHFSNRPTVQKSNAKRYAENRLERIAKMQQYRAANPEKVKESLKRYYQNNKAACKARRCRWAAENADSLKEYQKVYHAKHYEENKKYYYIKSAKAKSRLRKATPKWADMDKILAIYKQAALMSTDEVKYSVDHVIPLKGKTICGFHVENNLQVITLQANKSKGNRWNE